jgi:putative membrane protein
VAATVAAAGAAPSSAAVSAVAEAASVAAASPAVVVAAEAAGLPAVGDADFRFQISDLKTRGDDMKTATNFFTAAEQQQIETAVKRAETITSGEIVPMVVASSYDYPRAELIGGGTLALGLGLLISWWFGDESIWWFLPVFLVAFAVFFLIIRSCPKLKRKLIHPDELTEETRERALVAFMEQGLHATRDKTGILILISLFEHRVQVLADSGINAKVPEQTWDEIVTTILSGIKQDNACDALCQAIERCGALLTEHFPRKQDDNDELPNLIVE